MVGVPSKLRVSIYLYIYSVLQKYCPTLTHYPARKGQRLLGPGLWYIILICYQHVTQTMAPGPLLLYEPEDYGLAENRL